MHVIINFQISKDISRTWLLFRLYDVSITFSYDVVYLESAQVSSLTPRPSLAALFAAVEKRPAHFSKAAKKAARECLGTRLPSFLVAWCLRFMSTHVNQ